jgi:hypothetical protein
MSPHSRKVEPVEAGNPRRPERATYQRRDDEHPQLRDRRAARE